jgi:hypothetical protein
MTLTAQRQIIQCAAGKALTGQQTGMMCVCVCVYTESVAATYQSRETYVFDGG